MSIKQQPLSNIIPTPVLVPMRALSAAPRQREQSTLPPFGELGLPALAAAARYAPQPYEEKHELRDILPILQEAHYS